MSLAQLPPGFETDLDLGLGSHPAFVPQADVAALSLGATIDRPLPAAEEWRGDQRQFMALLVCALPDLRAYARRLAGRGAEGSDLVQETCRRAIESRFRFLVGSDMRAWLCRILRNLHCDILRRASRETLVRDDDIQFATPPAEQRPRWSMVSDDDLELALASLQPQYQRAYILHAREGRSYGEIAETLHVPCSTVGTRILRARLLLRSFLLKRIEAQMPPEPTARSAPSERPRPTLPVAGCHR
jgi:RNA polymerase sigma-70 factor (ECF subfamily)